MNTDSLSISDFQYDLPDDRIAYFPLRDRDSSKLLVYHKGSITHTTFKSLVDFVPGNSVLFFNDTRVIPARMLFRKETGAQIEIFLLNPLQPSSLLAEAMTMTRQCTWECAIGNAKRWKETTSIEKTANGITVTAVLVHKEKGHVSFTWSPQDRSFAEVVSAMGVTPLPPYIKREPQSSDAERYQTIYSHAAGAVAAPTAGLHFTETVLNHLKEKGIPIAFLTLHVSAGTFQPVKSDNALEHTMHGEQVEVRREILEQLLQADRTFIPVGTTSMRTLESLYWFGVKLLQNKDATFIIHQNDPYRKFRELPRREEALSQVLQYMDRSNSDTIVGHTSIYIRPGYSFKICSGLITNFHLPGSTLILLVAAFVGNDWKQIYGEAIRDHYRFLSYGDSSLLLP